MSYRLEMLIKALWGDELEDVAKARSSGDMSKLQKLNWRDKKCANGS